MTFFIRENIIITQLVFEMYITRTACNGYVWYRIINAITEITIVANKYLKEKEMVEGIMHDSPNYEYHFKFLNEEKNSIKDWITNLKEKGAKEVYIDFAPPKNILTVAYTNATPAGIICKYNDGKITGWHKAWNWNSETKKGYNIPRKIIRKKQF